MNLLSLEVVPRLWKRLSCSLRGIGTAWRSEEPFRLEILLFIVLGPASFITGDTAVEIAILWFSIVFVLVTELLNTGVEYAIDRIGKEWNATSRDAKDICSAAVLVSLINLVTIWCIVLFF